jgi:hypothetical protein
MSERLGFFVYLLWCRRLGFYFFILAPVRVSCRSTGTWRCLARVASTAWSTMLDVNIGLLANEQKYWV